MAVLRGLQMAILCLLVALATGGCSVYRGAERGVSKLVFSPSMERQLGATYADQIVDEVTLIEDPEVQAWVDDMGYRLVETSPPTKQDFLFHVTTNKEVNAFAIPGGFCYVNLGLILYADNEAQVAAVMGHEVNHVTKRHGLMRIQRGMGLGVLVAGASILVEDSTARAATVAAGSGAGFLAMQKGSRDDEREADKYGVAAMYEAGWDPREGAKFFDKLHQLSGGGSSSAFETWLSTHPPSPERVKNIEKQIADYDLNVPMTVNTARFKAMQARLRAEYGDLDTQTTSVPRSVREGRIVVMAPPKPAPRFAGDHAFYQKHGYPTRTK